MWTGAMFDPGKNSPFELWIDRFHQVRCLQRVGKGHDRILITVEHPNGFVLHLGNVPSVMLFFCPRCARSDGNKIGNVIFPHETVLPGSGCTHAAAKNVDAMPVDRALVWVFIGA